MESVLSRAADNGAALREREFRLYKDIRVEFRRNARPSDLVDYLPNLTDADREKVGAVKERDGESAAASELLNRLRRRPNWLQELLTALRNPSIDQGFLADSIDQKSRQIQVVIKVKSVVDSNGVRICLDGQHCGEKDNSVGTVIFSRRSPRGISKDSELWKTLRERVIAKELMVFLTQLTMEEEDKIETLVSTEGNIAATEHLLETLLSKEHGLKDLTMALSYPDLGLTDLAEKLKDHISEAPDEVDGAEPLDEVDGIRDGTKATAGKSHGVESTTPIGFKSEEDGCNTTKAVGAEGGDPYLSAVEKADAGKEIQWKSGMSVEEHRQHVYLAAIDRMFATITKPEDVPKILQYITQIREATFADLKNGSIVITLDMDSVESLETLWRFYLGDTLLDLVHRDLLTDARMKEMRDFVKKFGLDFQDVEFSTTISPVDFYYSKMNLQKNVVTFLPSNPLESVAAFKLGSSQNAHRQLMDLRIVLTPSLIRSLDDPFVQGRIAEVYALLDSHKGQRFALGYIEWLFSELYSFVGSHAAKDHLQGLGSIISRTVRFSGTLENGKFEFEFSDLDEVDSVVDSVCLSARIGRYHISLPRAAWTSLLDQEILVQKKENIYIFQSTLLQDFLMMPISKQRVDSGIVLTDFSTADTKTVEHSLSKNYFHLFTHYLYQFIVTSSSLSTEIAIRDILHLPLQDPKGEQVLELVVLSSAIARAKGYPVGLMNNILSTICQHLYPNGDVGPQPGVWTPTRKQALRIFLSLRLIESIALFKDVIWQKGTPSLTFSNIPVDDLREVMDLLHLSSCLGSGSVTIHREDEGRLVDFNVKMNANFSSSLDSSQPFQFETSGKVSLNLSNIVLSPAEDFGILLHHLPLLHELHSLNLTKTGLPSSKYRNIISTLRSTCVTELYLNENRLQTGKPLGLHNTPHLHRLELDSCKLGDHGLLDILQDFESIPNLLELSLAGNDITKNSLVQLCSTLKSCRMLRALRIHENTMSKGTPLLMSVLLESLPMLEILNLSEVDLGPSDVDVIARSLSHRNISKINFRKCKLSRPESDTLFKSLKQCKFLQHLDFSQCDIGGDSRQEEAESSAAVEPSGDVPSADKSFMDMINANSTSWDYLSLWSCKLGDSVVFHDPKQLFCLNGMTHLCLQDNQLDDSQALCLVECMKQSWHGLRHLNLRKNYFTDDCAHALQEGIRKNLHLKEVFLDMNRFKAQDTITDFINMAIGFPSLQELDVSLNTGTKFQDALVMYVEEHGIGTITLAEGYFHIQRGALKITV